MPCKQQGCEKDAVAIAHWPGQDSEQCEEHCRGMNSISNAMGFGKLSFTSLETGQTMQFFDTRTSP